MTLGKEFVDELLLLLLVHANGAQYVRKYTERLTLVGSVDVTKRSIELMTNFEAEEKYKKSQSKMQRTRSSSPRGPEQGYKRSCGE